MFGKKDKGSDGNKKAPVKPPEKKKAKTSGKVKKGAKAKPPLVENKAGNSKNTVVLVVILVVSLLGAGVAILYPVLLGKKPAGFNDRAPGQSPITASSESRQGEGIASDVTDAETAKATVDEETGENPSDAPGALPVVSSGNLVPPAPIVPSDPPESQGKTITETTGKKTAPPAARTPIAVRIPPKKEKIPVLAGSPEDYYEPPPPALPTPGDKEKAAAEKAAAAKTATSQKGRLKADFNKNVDERKTIIDVDDEIFIPRGSLDNLFSWESGKSLGDSKSVHNNSPNTSYSSVSDLNPELKLSKMFYMVLVRESNDVEELRAVARKLRMSNPAPEIKATVSFGRPIYWLTVGHYTSEHKAFNKAQEIREQGFPTTIVSEKIHY